MDVKITEDIDQHPVAENVALADSIPVIDFQLLTDGLATDQAVLEIAEACRHWGFFQLVNHNISNDLIENVLRCTRRFFELPVDVKESILRSRDNPWGYYNNELTKNQRDKKEVFDFTSPGVDDIYRAENRWLSDEQEFKAVMQEYYRACSQLSLQLLQTFCRGINLPANFMHKDFENNHTSFVRLNYYPTDDPLQNSTRKAATEAGYGIHNHTDAGALTILLQDSIGGLQIHKDNCWYNVQPVDGAFVINIGDMMQVWSNDIYKAAIHRVQPMTTSKRYSIPFFLNPAANAKISPLPTVITDEQPQRYRPIDWTDFRGKRSEGDYADYGTEIQISHYKL
ncbi:MAG: 2OG-Fe(II) oxygenase family protein [Oceanicoccus sp.]